MTVPEPPANPGPDDCARQCAGWGCAEPGQLPRCQLCPHSPTYWRGSPDVAERAQAETERIKNGEQQ